MNKSDMNNQDDFKGAGWYAPIGQSFLGKDWTGWVYLSQIEKDDTATAAQVAEDCHLGTPQWFEPE